MGDFGNQSGMENMSNPEANQWVYAAYRDHCAGKYINTELAITEALRNGANSNVTGMSVRSCDLVGWAKAGHAAISFLHDRDLNFLSERIYAAPESRLEGGLGALDDTVKFGGYEITFQGRTWQFYIARWTDEMFGVIKMCFILSPKSDDDLASTPADLDDLILAASKWTSELHSEIYVFDDGHWQKNKKLWSAVQSSSWDDVILNPTMKDTLVSDVQKFFDSRELYEEYAVPWKRGIIFHGTPGCGKTISIKALMNTLEKRDPPVASLYVKTFQNCRGEHYSIREIFVRARSMAPCLLVFEDLDSLVVDKVRSYFLNEVDGLEDNNGILMIGSTNHLERLDPGISKRPSRFDRKYHFKIPGARERMLYCEYWKKKLERNSNVDFDAEICDVVAQLTEGFSFAYLKELFVQTLLTIVGGRESEVEDEEEIDEIADKAKVIDGSAKVAVGDEKISSTEGEEGTKKVPEHKMPSVVIPESVKDNPLMRILHKQAIALWKDMDNTRDEEVGVKVSGDAKTGNVRVFDHMMPTAEVEAVEARYYGNDDDDDDDDDDD